MSTLRKAWEDFVCLTIPPAVSDATLAAQRAAFYAGAAALWGVFEQADANREEAQLVLRRVQREMEEHAAGASEQKTGKRTPDHRWPRRKP